MIYLLGVLTYKPMDGTKKYYRVAIAVGNKRRILRRRFPRKWDAELYGRRVVTSLREFEKKKTEVKRETRDEDK